MTRRERKERARRRTQRLAQERLLAALGGQSEAPPGFKWESRPDHGGRDYIWVLVRR